MRQQLFCAEPTDETCRGGLCPSVVFFDVSPSSSMFGCDINYVVSVHATFTHLIQTLLTVAQHLGLSSLAARAVICSPHEHDLEENENPKQSSFSSTKRLVFGFAA